MRPRASWREPVLWLVIGLPLVTVIASTLMIRLALRDPADASGSSTRRIAQMQLEDLSWDREAARLGVRVQFQADATRGEIRVRLSPDQGQSQSLDLVMRHPTQARHDRVLTLERDGNQWRARTPSWAATQAWEVEVASTSQRWRVAGRLAPQAREAALVPQVGR